MRERRCRSARRHFWTAGNLGFQLKFLKLLKHTRTILGMLIKGDGYIRSTDGGQEPVPLRTTSFFLHDKSRSPHDNLTMPRLLDKYEEVRVRVGTKRGGFADASRRRFWSCSMGRGK